MHKSHLSNQLQTSKNNHNMEHSKMNHYYYYYHHNNYNGSCSSSRLQINNNLQLISPPPTTKQQEEQPKIMMTRAMRQRRVQVVYYLSRNGQLEHPHFMELTLTSPHLHLKDVLQRLVTLRGRDMPSLYSWSCKRRYKNGYVWNDLSHNDVVYPSQAPDEYVLKGSHLPQNTITQTLTDKQRVVVEEDDEENSNSTSSYSLSVTNTPRPSKSSVGISTDDIDILKDHHSPPLSALSLSSSASDKCIVEPSRNSVLLQLVACGGRSNKCVQMMKGVIGERKDERKAVVCKSPVKSCECKVDVVNDVDKAMIKCMSENPRFGGFQTENKEYFSGSFVEDVAVEERVTNALARSNSFNEPRKRAESGAEEEERTERRDEVKVGREMAMRRKCIPRRKKKQGGHHKC